MGQDHLRVEALSTIQHLMCMLVSNVELLSPHFEVENVTVEGGNWRLS